MKETCDIKLLRRVDDVLSLILKRYGKSFDIDDLYLGIDVRREIANVLIDTKPDVLCPIHFEYPKYFPEEDKQILEHLRIDITLEVIFINSILPQYYNNKYKDVEFYELIFTDGFADSVVRERIFELISKAYEISYNTVYRLIYGTNTLEKGIDAIANEKDREKVLDYKNRIEEVYKKNNLVNKVDVIEPKNVSKTEKVADIVEDVVNSADDELKKSAEPKSKKSTKRQMKEIGYQEMIKTKSVKQIQTLANGNVYEHEGNEIWLKNHETARKIFDDYKSGILVIKDEGFFGVKDENKENLNKSADRGKPKTKASKKQPKSFNELDEISKGLVITEVLGNGKYEVCDVEKEEFFEMTYDEIIEKFYK